MVSDSLSTKGTGLLVETPKSARKVMVIHSVGT